MLAFAFALFTGVLALQTVSALPPSHLLGDALPLLLLWGFYQPKTRVLLMLLLGFFAANWQAEQVLKQDLPPALWNQVFIVTGVVRTVQVQARKIRFDLDVQRIEGYPDLAIGRVKLTWYHAKSAHLPILAVHDIWQMQLKLRPLGSYRNQYSLDSSRYALLHKIRHQGYVLNKAVPPVLLGKADLNLIEQLRQHILQTIKRYLGSHPQRGLVEALSVGMRDNMHYVDWQVLRQTGTSHLVAISGLHIGYIGLLAWLLAAGLYRHLAPVSWVNSVSVSFVAFSAAVLAAIFYALLSGMAIPAQRALLMLAFPTMARLFYRHIALEKILALSFILILLWDTQAVLSASFYLSFVAVALMFWGISAYPHKQKNSLSSHKIDKSLPTLFWSTFIQPYQRLVLYPYRYIRSLLSVSVIIMLGMLPLSLYWFQGVSWVSPLANLVAIPLIAAIILPLILLALFCLPIFPQVSGFIWEICANMLGYLRDYLQFLTQLNGFWEYGQLSDIHLLVAISLSLLLLLPRGIFPRPLLLLSALLLFYNPKTKPEFATVTVNVFDVGQGLSILLQTQNHSLLYDTGIRKASQQVILPEFKARGIKKLDTLLISHHDRDHSGGTGLLTKKIQVKQLLSSEPLFFQQLEIPKKHCQSGQHWRWDGVDFEILHPKSNYGLSSNNDNSCVLKVRAGKQSLLITGDISQKAEGFLLQMQYAALKSQVLIVPHHGSHHSSRPRFINTVKPDLAIVSAGFLNSYHHPSPSVIAAYRAIGSKVLDTVETGQIQFSLGKSAKIIPHIATRHYWHHHTAQ